MRFGAIMDRFIFALGIVVSTTSMIMLVPVIRSQLRQFHNGVSIRRKQYLIAITTGIFVFNLFAIFYDVDRLFDTRHVDALAAIYNFGNYLMRLVISSSFLLIYRERGTGQ